MKTFLHTFFIDFMRLFRRIDWRKYCLMCLCVVISRSCFADVDESIAIFIELLSGFFAVISIIIGPFVILAGWLLSPDWVMGDFFGLRPYFRDVWILVSNIVYIIFACMLLVMAVLQIFDGENKLAFKQKFPKFIVGILLVPFTWMIVSWTLSFANIAVAAVLSFPMGSITQSDDGVSGQNTSGFHEKILPQKMNFSFFQDPNFMKRCDNGKVVGSSPEIDCLSAVEFFKYNEQGPFFVLIIYAYDIFKIQKTDQADLMKVCKPADSQASGEKASGFAQGKDCIKSLTQLLIKFGTNIITIVFFTVLVIALCWVLIMRALKMWMYIMFSPLFGLAYFTGHGWEEAMHSGGGGGESSGLTSLGFIPFFKLAMVPVMVAAVLGFGLMFVGVIRDTFSNTRTGQGITAGQEYCTKENFAVKYCITQDASNKEGYTSRLIIGNEAEQISGKSYEIQYTFSDTLSDSIGTATNGIPGGAGAGVIESVEDIFAHIILTVIALAIIWMGVQTAVKHDEVTKFAFAPFDKFRQSVSSFVAHAPSYIPLPHPAFQALTPGGMSAMAQMLDAKISTDKAKVGKSLADVIGGQFKDFEKAVDRLNNGAGKLDDVANAFERLANKDPAKIKAPLLKAFDTLSATVKNDPKVQALKSALQSASPGQIDNVLNDPTHADAMNAVEGDVNGSGIKKIATSLGAQTTAASQPFADPTIDPNGSITVRGAPVVTPKTPPADGFTVTLTTEQKKKVKETFPAIATPIPANTPAQDTAINNIFGAGAAAKMTTANKPKLLEELRAAVNP